MGQGIQAGGKCGHWTGPTHAGTAMCRPTASKRRYEPAHRTCVVASGSVRGSLAKSSINPRARPVPQSVARHSEDDSECPITKADLQDRYDANLETLKQIRTQSAKTDAELADVKAAKEAALESNRRLKQKVEQYRADQDQVKAEEALASDTLRRQIQEQLAEKISTLESQAGKTQRQLKVRAEEAERTLAAETIKLKSTAEDLSEALAEKERLKWEVEQHCAVQEQVAEKLSTLESEVRTYQHQLRVHAEEAERELAEETTNLKSTKEALSEARAEKERLQQEAFVETEREDYDRRRLKKIDQAQQQLHTVADRLTQSCVDSGDGTHAEPSPEPESTASPVRQQLTSLQDMYSAKLIDLLKVIERLIGNSDGEDPDHPCVVAAVAQTIGRLRDEVKNLRTQTEQKDVELQEKAGKIDMLTQKCDETAERARSQADLLHQSRLQRNESASTKSQKATQRYTDAQLDARSADVKAQESTWSSWEISNPLPDAFSSFFRWPTTDADADPDAGTGTGTNSDNIGERLSHAGEYVHVSQEPEPEAKPEAEPHGSHTNPVEPEPQPEPEMREGVPPVSTDQAKASKDRATALEADGNYYEAALSFQEALDQLPSAASFERSDIHSHRASCFERLEQYTEVVEACTAALEYDGSSTSFKLDQLLRCSRAYERREKYGLAVREMQRARDLAPASIPVQKELARLEKVVKSLTVRESRASRSQPEPDHPCEGQSQQSYHDSSAPPSRLQPEPEPPVAFTPAPPRKAKIDMFGSDSDSD